MKPVKIVDIVISFVNALVETVTFMCLAKTFCDSLPLFPLALILLFVLTIWNFAVGLLNKHEEIPKVGYVIVNVDDPDKELLAIKLMVGESELLNKEEIAFDVVKES